MTDSLKNNAEDTVESASGLEGTAPAKPTADDEQIQSNRPSKAEDSSISTPSTEEIVKNNINKPPVIHAEPIETRSDPKPTPVNVAIAPKAKPVTAKTKDSPMIDSSISIDKDIKPNVGALIIDAIAAAVAIAFTVLLAQDVIPFLK